MILTGRVYPAIRVTILLLGENHMPGLLPDVDPDGLLEYSVVYTDRAINHMSAAFQSVMTDLSAILRKVYNADAVAIVPGSGTFGMAFREAGLSAWKR
jgi:aspartate aminotransferase-like enzyme